MWACKKGHKDTAVLLCQWYQAVQSSNNNFNQEYYPPDILESVHQCTKHKHLKFSYTDNLYKMLMLQILMISIKISIAVLKM